MANHKSAEKRNRQRITRTARHRSVRTRLRGLLAKAREAVDTGNDNAAELVRTTISFIDRAASKNAVPTGRASRLKSRLALRLHKATASK